MLLGGETGDIERVARLAGRSRELLAASALLLAPGIALAASSHPKAGAAVLTAALAGTAGAVVTRAERRRELFRLVAAGRTSDPAVHSFALELLKPTRRRHLAEGLRRAARAGEPGLQELTHIRPERAHALQTELLDLAAAIADQSRALRPESAALCRRLLCEPIVSPLYNANLPIEELEHALHEIRAGVGNPVCWEGNGQSGCADSPPRSAHPLAGPTPRPENVGWDSSHTHSSGMTPDRD